MSCAILDFITMHKSEFVFVNLYQSHVSKLPNGKLDKPESTTKVYENLDKLGFI
jgi:hypothetical protein